MERLENETLPTFFRHSRFQSLVRQLNFYNFRKINRERTFWVYRHPTFHRDRPEQLTLLKRRSSSCGSDGRRSKTPEYEVAQTQDHHHHQGHFKTNNLDEEGATDVATISISSTRGSSSRRSKKRAGASLEMNKTNHHLQHDVNSEVSLTDLEDPESSSLLYAAATTTATFNDNNDSSSSSSSSSGDLLNSKKRVHHQAGDDHKLLKVTKKKSRHERVEHALVVSEITQKLEEYSKLANVVSISNPRCNNQPQYAARSLRSNGGVITPPPVGKPSRSLKTILLSDTMRYHALTYDDECGWEDIDNFDGDTTKSLGATPSVVSQHNTNSVVSDGDESEADLMSDAAKKIKQERGVVKPIVNADEKLLLVPPVQDSTIISSIIGKLFDIHPVTSAVAEFCMKTSPHDASLENKTIQFFETYKALGNDFITYRAALYPGVVAAGQKAPSHFIRDFRIFMINDLANIISNGEACSFDVEEVNALSKTLNRWRDSWFTA